MDTCICACKHRDFEEILAGYATTKLDQRGCLPSFVAILVRLKTMQLVYLFMIIQIASNTARKHSVVFGIKESKYGHSEQIN